MKLQINQTTYKVSLESQIKAQEEMVIIDNVGDALSFNENYHHRLIILFDQARTARWFASLIIEKLAAGQESLSIQKTSLWDSNYPLGYSYND